MFRMCRSNPILSGLIDKCSQINKEINGIDDGILLIGIIRGVVNFIANIFHGFVHKKEDGKVFQIIFGSAAGLLFYWVIDETGQLNLLQEYSNMKDVYYRPNQFNQGQLDILADNNIKEDRTSEDLLFQVMLDLGVLLSSKIEETTIDGKKVFSVAGGYLIACFDRDVTDETVREIAKQHPFYAIFRDAGIASDSVMTNFEQIFETYSPKTVRRVL